MAQEKMPPGWQSSHVNILEDGRLEYFQDADGNTIPDFSRVGYHHGDKGIPRYSATITLSPVSGDNSAHIQRAIDSIASMQPDREGHRGTLLLRSGLYPVAETIQVGTSGRVIAGEGSGPQETRLLATKR